MQPIAPVSTTPDQLQGAARPVTTRVDAPGIRAAVPAPDESQIRKAIEAANAALRQVTSDLEFARDEVTGQTVVRVIDSTSRQVIRQFPSEEMLAIARALDRFQGLLIRQKA